MMNIELDRKETFKQSFTIKNQTPFSQNGYSKNGDFSNKNPKIKTPFEPVTFDKDFASFTKHTTGFGLKMLQKFGFKGRLGKNETGRVNPIIPRARSSKKKHSRAGLDYKGIDRKEKEFSDKNDMFDLETNLEEDFGFQNQNWRKGMRKKSEGKNVTKSKKIKRSSGVVYDFTKNNEGEKIRLGREKTVRDRALFPELRLNLFETVENIEQELASKEEEKNSVTLEIKDLNGRLAVERNRLEVETERLKKFEKLSQKLQQTEVLISDFISCAKDTSRRINLYQKLWTVVLHFEQIQNSHETEFLALNLSSVLFNSIADGGDLVFSSWTPLANNEPVVSLLKKLKELFSASENPSKTETNQPTFYQRFIQRSFMNKLMEFINFKWDPTTQNEALSKSFGELEDTLSTAFLARIFSAAMVPKLIELINKSNMVLNPNLCSRVLPWKNLFGSERVSPLVDAISTKIINLDFGSEFWFINIKQNFGNETLMEEISVLSEIDPQKALFVVKEKVLPLVGSLLQRTDVTPSKQDKRVLDFVSKYQFLFPVKETSILFERNFFPRWISIAYLWVTQAGSEKKTLLKELHSWYQWWRSAFPSNLIPLLRFNENIKLVLDIMNSAVYGYKVPPLPILLNKLNQDIKSAGEKTELNHSGDYNNKEATVKSANKKVFSSARIKLGLNGHRNTFRSSGILTFKEIVCEFAEKNNVSFFPRKGEDFMGKTVFSFNNHRIYLDDGCAFMKRGDKWEPVSLEELL